MAGDPEIRVSVTAVTGEAAAQLKSFADQQAVIQQRLTAAQIGLTSATGAYRDALRQLVPIGASANDINAASLAILTEYRGQVDQAKAAIAEQTAALKALKVAQVQTTESTELFSFAQSEASTQTGHLTQNLYAAQGASRLLSGNVPTRAFERFISIIPGLGAALGAAFPIIGAIALIEIIGEGIEKIHKMRQEAEETAQNIDLAFRRMGDSLREANDNLLTQTAHLEEQLDRAFKKPGENGASEAFYEAAAAADKLGVSIDRDIEKLDSLLSADNKKTQIGFWQSLFSGKAETGDTSEFIKKQVDAIRKVNDDYSDLVARAADSGDKKNLAQAQQSQLVALEKAYKSATDAITGDLQTVTRKQEDMKEGGWGEDQTAKINLLRGALQQLGLEQKNIGEQFENESLQQKVVAAPKGPKENYADELAAEQLAHGKSLGQTVLYWEQVVEKTGKYHEQLLRAEEAFQKSLSEKGKLRAALDKTSEKREDQKEPTKPIDLGGYYDKTSEAYARYREEVTRGNEILAENAAKVDLARIAYEEQSGAISKVAADHARGAVEARVYSERIDELRTQLKQLQASIPQATQEGKLPEAEAEIQKLNNQIAQLQGQQQVGGIQNQSRTAQDIAAPYLRGTDMINSAWLQMQNKLIFGTRNISQAFANMGVSMLESVAAAFEKMLVQQLKYEIQSRIAHQASNTIKTTSDAQAAVAGQAIQTSSALRQEFISAKVAATNTYASVSAIPIVGPALAPIAAGAAFTAVLALGAFEQGGITTKSGIYNLHEGEATLPKNLTSMLTSVANNYGGNSSSTSVSSTSHFSGITDRNFRDMARRNGEAVFDAAHKAVRGGRRRVG